MKKYILFIVACLILSTQLWAGATSVSQEIPLDEVAKAAALQELQTYFDITRRSIDIVVLREGWNDTDGQKEIFQNLEMVTGGKENKTLSFTMKPEAQKGTGRLIIGKNIWTYNPVKRSFTLTIDVSTELGSLLSGDETKREVTGYYHGTCNGYEAHMVRIHDKEASAILEIWFDVSTGLQLLEDRFNERGARLSRMEILSYVQLSSGAYYPSSSKTWSYLQPNVLWRDRIIDIREEDVPDDYFTKAYVERVCR
ncbi:MAG: outer membrane lipoprotein-sorting protein [Sphaerochaetaceae bacterium]|nr:outer membrane lipoprotein-sorting protein [Sphaerochaetaceae bacterium]